MKTAPVKELVEEVLATFHQPHGEDVIEDVFLAIERNPQWLQAYRELRKELTRDVVNQWGGHWIAQAVGMVARLQVAARRSTLIGSYSKLE